MKIFKHFNKANKCLICGGNKDRPTALIKIVGTGNDNIVEYKQVHIECLDLWANMESGIIYQVIPKLFIPQMHSVNKNINKN